MSRSKLMNIKGIKLPASTFVHSHQEKKCKLWAFHPDCHHPHCGQFSSLVRFCLVISFSVCYTMYVLPIGVSMYVCMYARLLWLLYAACAMIVWDYSTHKPGIIRSCIFISLLGRELGPQNLLLTLTLFFLSSF